jgi:hypothetical protein
MAVSEQVTTAPPWSGEHHITRWAPGTEVRFDKPLSGAFFVRLPMALAILIGPALWVAMGQRQQPDLTGQVIVSVLVGAVGVWLGIGNLLGARDALPERVTFDWSSRRLIVSGLRRRAEVPFHAITAIDVSGVWVARKWQDVSKPFYVYRCRLFARTSPASTASGTQFFELVATDLYREAPVTPMEQAVGVATELARALGVPHYVTDYPERPW